MIVVPLPPDPHQKIQSLVYRDMERARSAAEAFEQALTDQYAPGCADLHQVFFRPLNSDEWQSLGYTTGPLVSMDYGAPDPSETAVITWPHQYGKTATLTASIDVPLTDGLRALFDALAASHRASLEQRLRRLADDLGQWEPHVRFDFHRVQQVLEDAGIGDGYGQLTIPQPVRPPIEPPTRS